MVDNRKVRLMTRLAMYENGNGKEDIQLGHFFRRDYIRFRLFKNLIAVTLGFMCIAGFVIVYNLEYLIANVVNIDYGALVGRVIGSYMIVATIYLVTGIVYDMIAYNRSRKKLSRYFRMLRKLRSFYRREENDEEEGIKDGE